MMPHAIVWLVALSASVALARQVASPRAVDERRDEAAGQNDPAGAVGRIRVSDTSGGHEGYGTGFWIARDRVVTCLHVLQMGATATIEMPGRKRHQITRIVGMDERADVIVVEASPAWDGPVLALRPGAPPAAGERVTLLISPLLFDPAKREGRVVFAPDDAFFGPAVLAAISRGAERGCSGAPIVDGEGRVVGMVRSTGSGRVMATVASLIAEANKPEGRGPAMAEWTRRPETDAGVAIHLTTVAMFASSGDLPARIAKLEEATRKAPTIWTAWSMLGRLRHESGDKEGAIAAFRSAAEHAPIADDAMTLASLLEVAGKKEEADEVRRRAVERDPEGAAYELRKQEGLRLTQRKRWEEGRQRLAAMVEGEPENFPVQLAYAECLDQLDMHKQSIPYFARALALEPRSPHARIKYGRALMEMGRLDDAEHEFRMALSIDPNEAEAMVELGAVHLNRGRADLAESVLPRLMQLDRPKAEWLMERIRAVKFRKKSPGPEGG
ncbi:MAG: tetratricopeptide repeat protein [Phycisphaerales bacterium]